MFLAVKVVVANATKKSISTDNKLLPLPTDADSKIS